MKLDQLRTEVKPPFHNFKGATLLRRPRMCGVCRLPVEKEGVSCQNCKYTCHEDCRFKVVSSCEPITTYTDLKSPSLLRTPETLRRTKSLDRYPGFVMDISSLGERLIVATFPRTEATTIYKNNLVELTRMLRNKYGTHYLVFNLSERRYDLTKLSPQLLEYGWPKDLAPPLERLCSICKSIDTWLSSDLRNVAVLHSKNDGGRAGVVVSAFMRYDSICRSAAHTLDKYAMQRFLDDKLAPSMNPSQRRYVRYFAGLLSGTMRMNNSALYLHDITLRGIPNFDGQGGCNLFVKVYQGMQHIYSSGVYTANEGCHRQILITFDVALQVRGDIFIKCYHRSRRPVGRHPIFRIQFHTSTIEGDHVAFGKYDLDDAITDPRFPENGKVELWFSYRRFEWTGKDFVQACRTPIENNTDALVRYDSYERFDTELDALSDFEYPDTGFEQDSGSEYATVRKEKKSVDVFATPVTTRLNLEGPRSIDSGISSISGVVRNYDMERKTFQDDQAHLDQLLHGMLKEIQSIPDTTVWRTSTVTRRTNGTRYYYPLEDKRNYLLFPELDDLYLDRCSPRRDPSYISPIREKIDPLEHLKQRHVTYSTPISSYDEKSHNWLSHQQEKLRYRREGGDRGERQAKERLLFAELRSSHHRQKPDPDLTDDVSLGLDFSSSSRETSPIKGSSYTLPLHVNTFSSSQSGGSLKPPIHKNQSAPSSPLLPYRTSSKDITKNRYPKFQTQSKSVVRQKSDTSYDRERPFLTTKRVHMSAAEQIANKQMSPHQVIAYSSLYRHQLPDSTDSSHRILDLLHPSTDSQSDTQHSPASFTHVVPEKVHYSLDVASLSPSMVGSSPPSSPTRSDRPATPAFPIPPATPPYQNQDSLGSSHLPPRSPNFSRREFILSPTSPPKLALQDGSRTSGLNGEISPSIYYGHSRPSSAASYNLDPGDIIQHHPKFVKDTSKYWYKPNISREDAIALLIDRVPGTFVVRDSNSFPGAYGLALKVAVPPNNIQNRDGDISRELVRHFLIEATPKGVHFKGCPNEPFFGSLPALVYQHSITNLALPCKLLLPDRDLTGEDEAVNNETLLEQGAACSVLYLTTVDVESLTGPQAVRRALMEMWNKTPLPVGIAVHFKVSNQGITLTDNSHKLFFRRHYPVKLISHGGIDQSDRRWTHVNEEGIPTGTSRCFGFVARKHKSPVDNQCHLFAELDPEQPAAAIVNFVKKVIGCSIDDATASV